ncbi:MAG: hypothetical protein JRI23_31935 [Deltaproteobacteria bacterium]|jgi:hypothetical protein|nr:hypothetical protein [Deltaproteobacteria bacterium]MBW2536835.1 hypothetical protein [Deltaproteobacteria bacterium]
MAAAVVLLCATATIAPWTLRNQVVLGAPVLVSTSPAMNVYLGSVANLEPGREHLTNIRAVREQHDEVGAAREFYRRGLANALADPGGYLSRRFQAFQRYFWPDWRTARGASRPQRSLFDGAGHVALTAGALWAVATLRSLRRRRPLMVGLLGVHLLLCASTSLCFFQRRFGDPCVPAAVMLAVFLVDQAAREAIGGAWRWARGR